MTGEWRKITVRKRGNKVEEKMVKLLIEYVVITEEKDKYIYESFEELRIKEKAKTKKAFTISWVTPRRRETRASQIWRG